MVWLPQVRRVVGDGDAGEVFVVGHRLIDDFLRFAGGPGAAEHGACLRARPEDVLQGRRQGPGRRAGAGRVRVHHRAADRLGPGAENVARISDGGSGLSAATVRRRLAAVSAFYGYLIARGDVGVETNPVPRGLPTRRRRRDGRGLPLVRGVRRLPRILEPGEVAALMAALRTRAGSGDGASDAAGRAASLRGARPAPRGSPPR